MGHRNLDAVLLAQPPVAMVVGRAAESCLMLMAKAAHDDTGKYFAGHAWLAMGMGYPANDYGARIIRRHIRVLVKAGYLLPLNETHGRNRAYLLTLPRL